MTRISRDESLLRMLHAVAERSSCLRNQVGALIVRGGRVVSQGYNGAPPGKPHCTPETCNTQSPCLSTVHAEANAIAFAARHGIPTEGAWMYCTYSPCLDCAKLILSSGIKLLAFERAYRDPTPLDFLHYEISYGDQVTVQKIVDGERVEYFR
jgi:dCMP deaminase